MPGKVVSTSEVVCKSQHVHLYKLLRVYATFMYSYTNVARAGVGVKEQQVSVSSSQHFNRNRRETRDQGQGKTNYLLSPVSCPLSSYLWLTC